jgi:hypothetical protein
VLVETPPSDRWTVDVVVNVDAPVETCTLEAELPSPVLLSLLGPLLVPQAAATAITRGTP